jgi:hypothetical protein
MNISDGTDQDKYQAGCFSKDEIMPYWVDSNVEYRDTDKKRCIFFYRISFREDA